MTTTRDPFGPPPLPVRPRRRVTDDVPDDDPGRRADALASFVLGTLGTLWFVVPPVLVLASLLDTWQLYGEPPDATAVAAARRHVALANAFALGLPAAGFLLALVAHRRLRRRPRALRFFAATTGVAAVTILMFAGARTTPPVPTNPVPRCQELSGGGNECPGG